MPSVQRPNYQHPMVRKYQEKQPTISKADVEKKLLKKFGIETSTYINEKDATMFKTLLTNPIDLLDSYKTCNNIYLADMFRFNELEIGTQI